MVKKPENQHKKLPKKIAKSGKAQEKDVEVMEKDLDQTTFLEEVCINLYGETLQTTPDKPDKKTH